VLERLFFALWPGDTERNALARLQGSLGLHGTRPTHPADLHLTLVFLGDLPPERRSCCEAAADLVRAAPFAIPLSRVGLWPRPRILWCRPAVTPPELLTLADGLAEALVPCGVPRETRPYAAHITLARQASGALDPRREWSLTWPVTGFVLAASRPGPPPRYRVLRRWVFSTPSESGPLCDNAPL
jgi:RNA 2',3'-cyclic 3'-phosphodiesterase